MLDDLRTCPNCGSVIRADAPDGLCLKCLVRLGAAPRPTDSREGLTTFDDHELLDKIGSGAVGVVFRARQISLDRIVAVNILRNSRLLSVTDLARFHLEAQTVARMTHPNIVAIYRI